MDRQQLRASLYADTSYGGKPVREEPTVFRGDHNILYARWEPYNFVCLAVAGAAIWFGINYISQKQPNLPGKQMISSESEESPGNSMEEGLALLIDLGK